MAIGKIIKRFGNGSVVAEQGTIECGGPHGSTARPELVLLAPPRTSQQDHPAIVRVDETKSTSSGLAAKPGGPPHSIVSYSATTEPFPKLLSIFPIANDA